jgi:hypothetical protein
MATSLGDLIMTGISLRIHTGEGSRSFTTALEPALFSAEYKLLHTLLFQGHDRIIIYTIMNEDCIISNENKLLYYFYYTSIIIDNIS